MAGAIQAVGSIMRLEYYYGPDPQFVFKPHNDIFHIIAAIGIAKIFSGLKREYWVKKKRQ